MITVLVIFILSLILFIIRQIRLKINFNKEKINSFECGFNPFLRPQRSFSIQFFKVLIIFLLFDIEIIIILPSPLFFSFYINSAVSLIIILRILILGLLFE